MARRGTSLIVAVAAVALLGLAGVALMPAGPPAAESIERLPAYHDPALLRQAWALPVARLYGPAGFVFQPNASFCGPTSIADLLRSEGRAVSPAAVLAASDITPIFGFVPMGLTLDQEAALLHRWTAKPVVALRGLSLTAFRQELLKANDPGQRLIVNFTRAPLFGRGHGHFSPVLGYLPGQDLVFVGDVNANYRPWLTSTARLYAAQDTVDTATNAKRGLLEVAVR